MTSGPYHVVWELTLRCDLACKTCGSRAARPRADELTTAECLDVVQQLADLGAREVSLIGGEAYLREDWDRVAAAIVDHGMRCTMVSGGRGFTDERAERAAAAGIFSVSVSVDGLREAHDRQRGVAGSFDAAIASMRALRRAGVIATANSQLNRLSAPDLEAMLDLFLAERVRAWQVAMTVPMGRAADRPEWLFQPWELLDLFPRLAAIAEKGRAGGLHLYPGNNVGYFGPHESVLREQAWTQHYQGCGAGTNTLGIEADGSIKGCPSLPTSAYVGGNVRERTLRDIWETTQELTFNRGDRTGELWGYCGDCYYKSVCKGGCSWTAHVFFGRRGNNPYCHHRAVEHAARGLRERLVRRDAPPSPATPFDHGSFDIVVEPLDTPGESAPRRLPLVP